MSQLLANLTARLALGPIPVEELLAAEQMAKAAGDTAASKALAAIIRDAWGTPADLFASLRAQYNFTVDCAAEPWNAKLPRWFGPGGEATDALAASLAGEVWFCNPPFSQIERWLRWIWSWYDPAKPRAHAGVLLIPATRTEQDWWGDLIEPYLDPASWGALHCELRLQHLRGRTHYVPPSGVSASSPRFGSCLLKWNPLQLR